MTTIKARHLREYLETRTNQPQSKAVICATLGIGSRRFRKLVDELLSDDADLPLLACVYYKTREVTTNGGTPKRYIRLTGGYMIYDPKTATDETQEIYLETVDWVLAAQRGLTRLQAMMYSRKPLVELLPKVQRGQIVQAHENWLSGYSAGSETRSGSVKGN